MENTGERVIPFLERNPEQIPKLVMTLTVIRMLGIRNGTLITPSGDSYSVVDGLPFARNEMG
ncbi:MAG TPA: hypothetical protein VI957_03090 [Candidatus Paceibacterota bacterium]